MMAAAHSDLSIRPRQGFRFVLTSIFLCVSIVRLGSAAPATEVNVALLVPYDDSYLFSFRRVLPAIQMGIEELNRDSRYLRHLRISLHSSDSKCNIAFAMDRAIALYMKGQVNVFFGPVCDFAVAPVARQITFWNIPMVSMGAMALDFSKHRSSTYPLLTRVGPVHFGTLSHFFSDTSRHYGWRKIKLVYSKGGQDYLIKSFCHLAIEALHYTLKEMDVGLEQDYYKLGEQMTSQEVRNVIMDEIGLEYGGNGDDAGSDDSCDDDHDVDGSGGVGSGGGGGGNDRGGGDGEDDDDDDDDEVGDGGVNDDDHADDSDDNGDIES